MKKNKDGSASEREIDLKDRGRIAKKCVKLTSLFSRSNYETVSVNHFHNKLNSILKESVV